MTRHARKTRKTPWSVLLATVFGIGLGGDAAAQPVASEDMAELHRSAQALKNTVDALVDYSLQPDLGNVQRGALAVGGLVPDVALSVLDRQVDRFTRAVRNLEIPRFDSALQKLMPANRGLELIAESPTARRGAFRDLQADLRQLVGQKARMDGVSAALTGYQERVRVALKVSQELGTLFLDIARFPILHGVALELAGYFLVDLPSRLEVAEKAIGDKQRGIKAFLNKFESKGFRNFLANLEAYETWALGSDTEPGRKVPDTSAISFVPQRQGMVEYRYTPAEREEKVRHQLRLDAQDEHMREWREGAERAGQIMNDAMNRGHRPGGNDETSDIPGDADWNFEPDQNVGEPNEEPAESDRSDPDVVLIERLP